LPRDPRCPYHTPYRDVVELSRRANEIKAEEILSWAESDLGQIATLALGRDFLIGFHCPACDQREGVNALLGRVEESRVTCPHSGAVREAEIDSRLAWIFA